MKKCILLKGIFISSLIFSSQLFADIEDEKTLLNSFHKYGMTKCDSFILQNSKLQGNWNYFISRHNKEIAKDVKEVSVIQIFGSKNDTVKIDHSYIESPSGCFLTKRSTLSFSGSCSENIDGNSWYLSNEMSTKDYNTYKNKHGIEMQAKEISMGNFKSCIQEVSIRDNSPLDK